MIRIITDGTCDITREKATELNLDRMIPMVVREGEKEYYNEEHKTGEGAISNEEFYTVLENATDLPTTSLVNVAEFEDIFNEYPEDDLIVFTISSELSGTYQSACIAKDMVERTNIHIIDTKSVSLGSALIIEEACNLRNEGLTVEQIVYEVEKLIPKVRLYCIVDTLKYLVKGGRLGKAAGTVGEVLNLKPILAIKDGKLDSFEKARGMKSGIRKLAEYVQANHKIDEQYPVYYAHANNKKDITSLQENIGETKDDRVMVIGSAVGTHTGPKAIAIVFVEQ